MRKTTERIAMDMACGVSPESVDMLFAPREMRIRGRGKYFIDSWAGMTRLIVCSTGRIVGVFEDCKDAIMVIDALNNGQNL